MVDPDAIQRVKVDRRTLPKGGAFRVVGFEKGQVVDLDIRRFVIEYQAEILENAQGQRFVAPFPVGVERSVQYGPQLKAHAVYLTQYPLLPYDRIREYFGRPGRHPTECRLTVQLQSERFQQGR